MAQEIERKFLLQSETWRASARPVPYRQGYIPNQHCVFRIRIAGDTAYLTLKGALQGITRSEYEYEIPKTEAQAMLDEFNVPLQITKIRHHIRHEGLEWVIDEFDGLNKGLIVAEIELQNENQPFPKPDWLGQEVSHDPRYSNYALSKTPYTTWQE